MRTLRKTLCLVLALVMLLGLGAFSVSASTDFKDDADINEVYDEAVEVITAVGIMQGRDDDGDGKYDFAPKEELKRQDATVIISRLLGVSVPAGTSSFADVDEYYQPYVALMETLGVTDGYPEDHTFRPYEPLTGSMFAKWLSVALGYSAADENMTGPEWEVGVAVLMKSTGLNNGVEDYNPTETLTREEAAQMALNALKADMVQYSGGIVAQAQGITLTAGGTRSKVTTNSDWGHAIDWTQNNDGYIVQLGESLFNGKLKQENEEDYGIGYNHDDFGRPLKAAWTYNSNDVYGAAETPTLTYTRGFTAATQSTLERALVNYNIGTRSAGWSDYSNAATRLWITNKTQTTRTYYTAYGDGAGIDKDDLITAMRNASGNGYLMEIYVNEYRYITDVVIAQYDVSSVSRITTDSNGDTTYRLKSGKTGVRYSNPLTPDTVECADTMIVDDVVTYVVASANDTSVLYLYPTTTVTGSQSSISSSNAITVEGQSYTLAKYVVDNYLTRFTNTTKTYNYYIDQYGYGAWNDEVTGEQDYAVVVSIVADTNALGDTAYKARLLFTDGKTADVELASSGSANSVFGSTTLTKLSATYTDNETVGAGANTTGYAYKGRIVTYTVSSSNGKYTLTDHTTNTVGDAVTAAYTVTENGKVSFTYAGTNTTAAGGADTVYLVRTRNGSSSRFTAYEGYSKVPTILATDGATVPVTYTTYIGPGNASYAKVVYIDIYNNANAVQNDTTKDVLYVSDATRHTNGTGSNVTYTLTSYVNGAKTTLTGSSYANIASTKNHIYTITYSSGKVSGLTDQYLQVASADAAHGIISAYDDGGGAANTTRWSYTGGETVYVIDKNAVPTGDTLPTGDITELQAGDEFYVVPKASTGSGQYAVGSIYILKDNYYTVPASVASILLAVNSGNTNLYVGEDLEITADMDIGDNVTLTVDGDIKNTASDNKKITVGENSSLIVNGSTANTGVTNIYDLTLEETTSSVTLNGYSINITNDLNNAGSLRMNDAEANVINNVATNTGSIYMYSEGTGNTITTLTSNANGTITMESTAAAGATNSIGTYSVAGTSTAGTINLIGASATNTVAQNSTHWYDDIVVTGNFTLPADTTLDADLTVDGTLSLSTSNDVTVPATLSLTVKDVTTGTDGKIILTGGTLNLTKNGTVAVDVEGGTTAASTITGPGTIAGTGTGLVLTATDGAVTISGGADVTVKTLYDSAEVVINDEGTIVRIPGGTAAKATTFKIGTDATLNLDGADGALTLTGIIFLGTTDASTATGGKITVTHATDNNINVVTANNIYSASSGTAQNSVHFTADATLNWTTIYNSTSTYGFVGGAYA